MNFALALTDADSTRPPESRKPGPGFHDVDVVSDGPIAKTEALAQTFNER